MTPVEMNCQTLVELVTDYLEGALPDRDRERLEAHLALCEGCTRYLAQIRTTIRLTGMLREEDLEPEARERLLGVYRAWREDAGATTQVPRARRRWFGSRRRSD